MTADKDSTRWNYCIVQVDSGRGDGVSVTLICNGKRIIVTFLPLESLSGTIEGSLIERYEAACLDEDEDEEEAAQQEIEQLIFEVGKPIFAQLAPPVSTGGHLYTNLHSLLYPETFFFVFTTAHGKSQLVQQDSQAGSRHPPPPMIFNNDLQLPVYSTKDIQVIEKIQGEGEITRVLVDRREQCCKSGEPYNWEAVYREFESLRKIVRSKHASLRTPKLTGLVTLPGEKEVIGILEGYIPTDLESLPTLREVDVSIAVERRQKWAGQIRETVDALHEIGVVWGDGKPRNVLIHQDTDDAWLIDFGGSWTEGWVDEQLMETVEGDQQAVRRIIDFLKI